MTGTTIQSNKGGGILLSGSTLGGTIASSTIGGATSDLGNGGVGVSITGSAGVTIGDTSDFSTLIANNMGVGISATNSSFVNFNSSALTLQGLIVQANQGAGIALHLFGDLKIEHDIVLDNQGDGIDIFSSGETMRGDIVASNLGAGILLSDNSEAAIDGLDDESNGSTGLAVVDSAIQLVDARISGNSGIGVSIIRPTNGNGPGTSLDLDDDAIQSNLGGGLLLSGATQGGTIESSTIGGMTTGLGNDVFGLSLINSPDVFIGYFFSESPDLIQYNGGDGISLVNSNNVLIQGPNFIADNAGDGISVTSSTGVLINDQTIQDNSGSGISLSGGSDGVSLTADAIYGNLGSGVLASGSSNLTIGGGPEQAVTITGNAGTGIAVSGATGVSIVGDVVAANRLGGIALDAVSGVVNFTTVGGVNPSLGNAMFGVSVTNSPGMILSNLLVLSNAGDGVIFASGSNGASIACGQVSGNAGAGVVVSGSFSVTIGQDGTLLPITGNLADGIDINFSPNAVVEGTEVGGNKLTGISVVSSPDVIFGDLASVLVLDNGGDGIDLSGSAGSSIFATTSMSNAGAGLSITSPGVFVSASNFLVNAGAGLEISGPGHSGNVISGVEAAGNMGFGILILNSGRNAIGTDGLGDLIESNGLAGVEIDGGGASNNVVEYDTIAFNGGSGVSIDAQASANIIGGVAPDAGNTIAANLGDGVAITNAPGNFVLSNDNIEYNHLSGIAITGNSAGNEIFNDSITFNQSDGVTINQADGTVIGGAGHPDVISSNRNDGISIEDSQNVAAGTPTLIEGSFIGTDPTGLYGQGNGDEGIHIEGSSGVQIGSTAAGAGDVVSANVGGGIELIDSSNNTLFGDRIGTDYLARYVVTGAISPQGQGFGVFVNQSSGNVIGGTAVGAGNIIAGLNNSRDFAIQVFGPNAQNNQVVGNFIGTTGPIGAAGTIYALGDHVGVYINGAQNTLIQANTLGGSDLAEILVSAGEPGGVTDSATISNTIIGNTLNGSFFAPTSTPPNNLAEPTGIVIDDTQGTLVMNNVIQGLTVGVETVGAPTMPNPFQNPLTTIEANLISNDAYGVLLNGSPSNVVSGNTLAGNSLVGIEAFGPQSTGNTIGGTANNLINNLYGIYIEDAPSNQILGNTVTDTGPYFTNPSQGIYQTGIS